MAEPWSPASWPIASLPRGLPLSLFTCVANSKCPGASLDLLPKSQPVSFLDSEQVPGLAV